MLHVTGGQHAQESLFTSNTGDDTVTQLMTQ